MQRALHCPQCTSVDQRIQTHALATYDLRADVDQVHDIVEVRRELEEGTEHRDGLIADNPGGRKGCGVVGVDVWIRPAWRGAQWRSNPDYGRQGVSGI